MSVSLRRETEWNVGQLLNGMILVKAAGVEERLFSPPAHVLVPASATCPTQDPAQAPPVTSDLATVSTSDSAPAVLGDQEGNKKIAKIVFASRDIRYSNCELPPLPPSPPPAGGQLSLPEPSSPPSSLPTVAMPKDRSVSPPPGFEPFSGPGFVQPLLEALPPLQQHRGVGTVVNNITVSLHNTTNLHYSTGQATFDPNSFFDLGRAVEDDFIRQGPPQVSITT